LKQVDGETDTAHQGAHPQEIGHPPIPFRLNEEGKANEQIRKIFQMPDGIRGIAAGRFCGGLWR
jgi:hypothetical protein